MRGYMIDVEFDGSTLRVRGRGADARGALTGRVKRETLVLARDEIVSVSFEDANRLRNGALRLRTADGRAYKLPFRRKQADEFRRLAERLSA